MLAALARAAAGASNDEPREDPQKAASPWSLFPILGYSPETSAMLGAGLVFTFEAGHEPVPAGRTARRSAIAFVSAFADQHGVQATVQGERGAQQQWRSQQELAGAEQHLGGARIDRGDELANVLVSPCHRPTPVAKRVIATTPSK